MSFPSILYLHHVLVVKLAISEEDVVTLTETLSEEQTAIVGAFKTNMVNRITANVFQTIKNFV